MAIDWEQARVAQSTFKIIALTCQEMIHGILTGKPTPAQAITR
jgi:hypothetical protein